MCQTTHLISWIYDNQACAKQPASEKMEGWWIKFFKMLMKDCCDVSLPSKKTTVSILDDIGSMFDDLADQLDAMLD